MINFYNGIPTAEEQQRIEQQIKRKYTGTDNAGRFILNFADDKAKGAELSSLNPPQLDKQFTALENTIQQQIFTGHKITSGTLFGIKQPGQLGNRNEMIEAATLFQNLYVSGKQQKIERVFNALLSADGLPECLQIMPIQPITVSFTDQILATALTKDEVRLTAGYEPVNESGLSDTLPPQAVVTMPTITTAHQYPELAFSATKPRLDETTLVKLMASHGKAADGYEVLRSHPVHFEKQEEALLFETQAWATKFAPAEDVEISATQSKILSILKANAKASIEDIARALKMNLLVTWDALDGLIACGLVDPNGDGGFDITNEGRNAVEIEEPVTADFKIMYRFNGTGVCTANCSSDMIKLNKLYTRAEIETLSAEAGHNLWAWKESRERKGGANFTKNNGGHTWHAQVVKKIKKGE